MVFWLEKCLTREQEISIGNQYTQSLSQRVLIGESARQSTGGSKKHLHVIRAVSFRESIGAGVGTTITYRTRARAAPIRYPGFSHFGPNLSDLPKQRPDLDAFFGSR
jgi:hypothetical protein